MVIYWGFTIKNGFGLVGGFKHLEKYEFVSGKDDIPYMKWKKTCSKPPTSMDDFPT